MHCEVNAFYAVYGRGGQRIALESNESKELIVQYTSFCWWFTLCMHVTEKSRLSSKSCTDLNELTVFGESAIFEPVETQR